MNISKMTRILYDVPFPLRKIRSSGPPEPMDIPFLELEKNTKLVVDFLWEWRQKWHNNALQLPAIWIASLRMTVMYLNMCDAFWECGEDFIREALDEDKFIEKYEHKKGRRYIDRASTLLARSAIILRALGFKSPLISIGGDSHYYGMCAESRECLERVAREKA